MGPYGKLIISYEYLGEDTFVLSILNEDGTVIQTLQNDEAHELLNKLTNTKESQ